MGWENLIQTFGIWFLAVWCGLFGRKEIGALLRIPRNPWFNYKLYARRPYLIGLGVGASQIAPLYSSLFLLLVLLFKFVLVLYCCLCVCCFSLCSPSWTPCFGLHLFSVCFNNILMTYQKKKLDLCNFCNWLFTQVYYSSDSFLWFIQFYYLSKYIYTHTEMCVCVECFRSYSDRYHSYEAPNHVLTCYNKLGQSEFMCTCIRMSECILSHYV